MYLVKIAAALTKDHRRLIVKDSEVKSLSPGYGFFVKELNKVKLDFNCLEDTPYIHSLKKLNTSLFDDVNLFMYDCQSKYLIEDYLRKAPFGRKRPELEVIGEDQFILKFMLDGLEDKVEFKDLDEALQGAIEATDYIFK